MLTIHVRLFGKLNLDGFGRERPAAGDGSFLLRVHRGSTVRKVISEMRVPAAQVGMTLVNGCNCAGDTTLSSGDRVVLTPQEFAALWPARLR